MNEPSVSVVIPAYRAAGTIRRAVDSVLAQTHPASEILIVDDGSPDDIGSAVEAYGERVTLIRKPNGGAASARNAGIDRSTGELIAFLDADDYWEPQKLEKHVEQYKEHRDIGLTCSRFFMEGPGAVPRRVIERAGVTFDRPVVAKGSKAFELATRAWTGTVVIRREVMGSQRFVPGLEPAEDRDLWVRLVTAAPVVFLSEPLATAVVEPGSLSRSSVDLDCDRMLAVVRRHRRLLGPISLLKYLSHTHYRWAACASDQRMALKHFAISFGLWPLPYPRRLTPVSLARVKLLARLMGSFVRGSSSDARLVGSRS